MEGGLVQTVKKKSKSACKNPKSCKSVFLFKVIPPVVQSFLGL